MSEKIFGEDWCYISEECARERVERWIEEIQLKNPQKWSENKLEKVNLSGPPFPKYYSNKFNTEMTYQQKIYAFSDEFLILRDRKKNSNKFIDSTIKNILSDKPTTLFEKFHFNLFFAVLGIIPYILLAFVIMVVFSLIFD